MQKSQTTNDYSSFTFNGAFASDGTYIYFSGSCAPRRLWRMKLDGSECEEYIQDMDFPKFVLGNTMLAVYNGKYDGAGNRIPETILWREAYLTVSCT